jgi:hypothetical protein
MKPKFKTLQIAYLIIQIFLAAVFVLNMFFFELPKQHYYFLMSVIFVLDVLLGLFIGSKSQKFEAVNLKILKVLTIIMSLALIAQIVATFLMGPFRIQDNLIAVFSFVDFFGFIVYIFKFSMKLNN